METIEHELEIGLDSAGLRLDQALAAEFPQYSRSQIKAWIDAGAVHLNSAVTRPRTRVAAGDKVRLTATLAASAELAPQAVEFDIAYADDHLIVIDKPAGLVVHPGAGNADRTLANGLLNTFPELDALPRAGLVHRLDKDTSGLLLVARSALAYQRLTELMAAREIRREYLALCNGQIISGGTIDKPIGRDPHNRLKMAVRSDGRTAVTHYRVEEKFRAHSLLSVTLETGRTHQIRVHMSHAGMPLVGDPVYGGRARATAGLGLEVVEEALAWLERVCGFEERSRWVDKDGVISKRHIGYNPETAPEEIETTVRELLGLD